ncbi:pilin [Candidatus Nomurabacteria bacterium]|nr:pilin [Candidatus Nomurabacteria bacterium]
MNKFKSIINISILSVFVLLPFVSFAALPIAVTKPPSDIQNDSAVLNGSAQPASGDILDNIVYRFQWGENNSYGNVTSLISQPLSDHSGNALNFSEKISNLKNNTTYHYRVLIKYIPTGMTGVVSYSQMSSVFGNDQTFKTGNNSSSQINLTASPASNIVTLNVYNLSSGKSYRIAISDGKTTRDAIVKANQNGSFQYVFDKLTPSQNYNVFLSETNDNGGDVLKTINFTTSTDNSFSEAGTTLVKDITAVSASVSSVGLTSDASYVYSLRSDLGRYDVTKNADSDGNINASFDKLSPNTNYTLYLSKSTDIAHYIDKKDFRTLSPIFSIISFNSNSVTFKASGLNAVYQYMFSVVTEVGTLNKQVSPEKTGDATVTFTLKQCDKEPCYKYKASVNRYISGDNTSESINLPDLYFSLPVGGFSVLNVSSNSATIGGSGLTPNAKYKFSLVGVPDVEATADANGFAQAVFSNLAPDHRYNAFVALVGNNTNYVLNGEVTTLAESSSGESSVKFSGLVPCGTGRNADGSIPTPCDFNYLIKMINIVINFILIALAVPISAIMFAYAGILMIGANGEVSKITQAKNIFTNVVIGLVFIAGSWLIIHAILSILGYDGSWIGF